jgi:hypothetical protein
MFGSGKTYFADSPVVIDISGLYWGDPVTSPFTVVRLEVVYQDSVIGNFRADTGGQTSISFDIQSALRAIWSLYPFEGELAAAQTVVSTGVSQSYSRQMRSYKLRVYTEYLDSEDKVYTVTQYEDAQGNKDIPGGQCLIGAMTEWERSLITSEGDRDVSHFEHTNVRNGDASTKPHGSPERVGSTSITSWVDMQQGFTKSIFYPYTATPQPDDVPSSQSGWTGHAPIVLRDSIPYTDFLFKNRRGAVETCSALMEEGMNIEMETEKYTLTERPKFNPTRTLMAIASGGRRSWTMSSGIQTREWAEWWVMEFLMAEKWWMLYNGAYTPVIVEPSRKSLGIYDRSKQAAPSIEFTVTLALEG